MLRRTVVISMFALGGLLVWAHPFENLRALSWPIKSVESGVPQYDLGDGLYYTPGSVLICPVHG